MLGPTGRHTNGHDTGDDMDHTHTTRPERAEWPYVGATATHTDDDTLRLRVVRVETWDGQRVAVVRLMENGTTLPATFKLPTRDLRPTDDTDDTTTDGRETT